MADGAPEDGDRDEWLADGWRCAYPWLSSTTGACTAWPSSATPRVSVTDLWRARVTHRCLTTSPRDSQTGFLPFLSESPQASDLRFYSRADRI